MLYAGRQCKMSVAKNLHYSINRTLGFEKVYLSLHKVADTAFHIQEMKLFSYM